jgi:hypothetical protein
MKTGFLLPVHKLIILKKEDKGKMYLLFSWRDSAGPLFEV